jgi:RNA polymerase sigma-70 factor (ECF subfamily)
MPESVPGEMIREAFRYQSALTSYAYGMLRDWSLAKDVVQDAFVLLLEKYGDNDPAAGVFPLMKKIVHFKALETLRKRKREVVVEDEELNRLVGDTLQAMVGEEEALQHNRRLGALHECMSLLDAGTKHLMVAFYWKRQSCEELAPVLRRQAPALRVALMRIREKLRDCMDQRLALAEVGQ